MDALIPQESQENYQRAFDIFKQEGTEAVPIEDLGRLMRAVGFNPSPDEIEDMADDIGEDALNFNTFLYIVYRHGREAHPDKELVDTFRIFDKEGKGTLKAELIRKILTNKRQPFTDEQVDKLFQIESPDDEGEVNYSRLVDAMLTG